MLKSGALYSAQSISPSQSSMPSILASAPRHAPPSALWPIPLGDLCQQPSHQGVTALAAFLLLRLSALSSRRCPLFCPRWPLCPWKKPLLLGILGRRDQLRKDVSVRKWPL